VHRLRQRLEISCRRQLEFFARRRRSLERDLHRISLERAPSASEVEQGARVTESLARERLRRRRAPKAQVTREIRRRNDAVRENRLHRRRRRETRRISRVTFVAPSSVHRISLVTESLVSPRDKVTRAPSLSALLFSSLLFSSLSLRRRRVTRKAQDTRVAESNTRDKKSSLDDF